MRIRHDKLIEICDCAELHKYHILFLTIDGKVFATYFNSVDDTKEAFQNLFTNGYLEVNNFIQTSLDKLGNN